MEHLRDAAGAVAVELVFSAEAMGAVVVLVVGEVSFDWTSGSIVANYSKFSTNALFRDTTCFYQLLRQLVTGAKLPRRFCLGDIDSLSHSFIGVLSVDNPAHIPCPPSFP